MCMPVFVISLEQGCEFDQALKQCYHEGAILCHPQNDASIHSISHFVSHFLIHIIHINISIRILWSCSIIPLLHETVTQWDESLIRVYLQPKMLLVLKETSVHLYTAVVRLLISDSVLMKWSPSVVWSLFRMHLLLKMLPSLELVNSWSFKKLVS